MKEQKRFHVRVDEKMHTLIKILAAKRNISMNKSITRAIALYIDKEKKL